MYNIFNHLANKTTQNITFLLSIDNWFKQKKEPEIPVPFL